MLRVALQVKQMLCRRFARRGVIVKTLMLPRLNTIESIDTQQSVLLVGANGSGKTRIGTWIELKSTQKNTVHRISAQKSLSLPDSTTPQSIELAEKDLLFGSPDWNQEQKIHKWSMKPATTMLNDYQKLMVYLFSDETEKNAVFKRASQASPVRIEPPITKLDLVKKIWETILPHRELIIGGLRIQTCIKDHKEKIYNSSEMSDGERVIFYLIGQCLAAPKDGIIVIDEPELHLHKSIQVPLWNEIEKIRNDCLFIYLTHDVDFATAKESAKKIWLKSFDGEKWDWELIIDDEYLPSELLIEILGSRKSVVFVEGENGSFDTSLYRELLPNFLIIPRGSCTQVIQSVRALKANPQIHHLAVYGIVDRDRRVDAEIPSLEQDGIFVLNVAEVENLFCTKEVLKIVSERLERDSIADFTTVANTLFARVQGEFDTQISMHVISEIKFQMSILDDNIRGKDNISTSLQEFVTNINVELLYNNFRAIFDDIIATRNYDKLLLYYNRKSLSSQISGSLGLANKTLPEMVIRLVRGESKQKIIDALKHYFGNFQQYMS